MLDNPTYEGFAMDDELEQIIYFQSDYKSRESIRRNLERCIHASYRPDFVADEVVIHQGLAAENIGEEVELASRDYCKGNPLFTRSDYEYIDIVIVVTKEEQTDQSILASIARDFGESLEVVKHLYDAFCATIEEEDLSYFEQYAKRLYCGM